MFKVQSETIHESLQELRTALPGAIVSRREGGFIEGAD